MAEDKIHASDYVHAQIVDAKSGKVVGDSEIGARIKVLKLLLIVKLLSLLKKGGKKHEK